MFYYIKGSLEFVSENFAAVDCGGVCYKIYTSYSTRNDISTKLGEEVKLYTTMIVREDTQDIYGFSTENELEIFKKLITVSGVGPKVAISVLSYLNLDVFCSAVTTDDSRTIASVPGVGAKTAQKIIIELKDKIPQFGSDVSGLSPKTAEKFSSNVADAVGALVVLGYPRNVVLKVMDDIDKTGSTEEIITAALKLLAKQ